MLGLLPSYFLCTPSPSLFLSLQQMLPIWFDSNTRTAPREYFAINPTFPSATTLLPRPPFTPSSTPPSAQICLPKKLFAKFSQLFSCPLLIDWRMCHKQNFSAKAWGEGKNVASQAVLGNLLPEFQIVSILWGAKVSGSIIFLWKELFKIDHKT